MLKDFAIERVGVVFGFGWGIEFGWYREMELRIARPVIISLSITWRNREVRFNSANKVDGSVSLGL